MFLVDIRTTKNWCFFGPAIVIIICSAKTVFVIEDKSSNRIVPGWHQPSWPFEKIYLVHQYFPLCKVAISDLFVQHDRSWWRRPLKTLGKVTTFQHFVQQYRSSALPFSKKHIVYKHKTPSDYWNCNICKHFRAPASSQDLEIIPPTICSRSLPELFFSKRIFKGILRWSFSRISGLPA